MYVVELEEDSVVVSNLSLVPAVEIPVCWALNIREDISNYSG